MVTKFFYGWRQTCGDNFFAVMRLLLPQLDRTTYGIKEAKIGKAYTEALGLGTQLRMHIISSNGNYPQRLPKRKRPVTSPLLLLMSSTDNRRWLHLLKPYKT
ncbi:unnamed protein product [Absidia cylindrospora]